MSTEEYINQLAGCLHGMNDEERSSALVYYREYLAEAGDNAAAAMEALGSPQSVAERILAEAEDAKEPYKPKQSVWVTVLLAIANFPLWITMLSLWLSLLITMAAILLAFAAATIIAPIQGIVDLTSSMYGHGLWSIGSGILSAGLALLLWKPFLKAAVVSTKYSFMILKKMIGIPAKEVRT